MVCRSSGSQVQTCVLGACRACSTGPLSLQSLAQSQSSDWWWSRCFKLFLCYMTKTCLLDHGCHHWVSHCLLAFPQKRSFVPTGLHLVFPVDTIAASPVILWNNSRPGYYIIPPCYQWSLILLLTIVFVLLMHLMPGNPLPCGISGNQPLDSFLCRFASLWVVWRDVVESGEQGLEPTGDGCEEGTGVICGKWTAGRGNCELVASPIWGNPECSC